MIRDLEENRVMVQATNPDPAQVKAEAIRGCAFHGRTAVLVSQQCVDALCSTQIFLFACERPVGRSSPWLGVSVADVLDHRFADPPGSSEVVISRIFADGPAKMADFRVGDIIESFNGVPVSSSGQIVDLKKSVRAGERITVAIRRGNSRLRLAMKVE
jgi:S1-C subfamily serine protease